MPALKVSLLVEGSKMAFRQVSHVDIVAHTCAVSGVVIVSEDSKVWKLATSDPLNVGHQVVWNALRVFTNESTFVRTNRIKIAKTNGAKIFIAVSVVLQDNFNHRFSLAIRVANVRIVHGVVLLRMRVLAAVDRRRRTEDDVVTAEFLHHLQHGDRAAHVVVIILEGLGNTYTNSLEASKVDH